MENLDPEVDYLYQLVLPLVAVKEAVIVKRSTDEMGVLLTLSLAPEDMGKIIGKQGQTAKAIRYLIHNYGNGHKMRVNVKINEPEGGRRMEHDFRKPMGYGEAQHYTNRQNADAEMDADL